MTLVKKGTLGDVSRQTLTCPCKRRRFRLEGSWLRMLLPSVRAGRCIAEALQTDMQYLVTQQGHKQSDELRITFAKIVEPLLLVEPLSLSHSPPATTLQISLDSFLLASLPLVVHARNGYSTAC
jgi:hypothetical protein